MSIVARFVYPPIPVRNFDWAVYDDDKCGCPECHQVVGYGPTEAAALADFREQMEEAA